MIEKYDKFLIFVAHPDDEVLGCGGVLKKLSKLNKKIRVVVLAEGSSCRYKNYIKSKKEIVRSIKERKNSCKKALKDLGVNDFIFYDLQCGKLSSMPITSVAKIIEKEIMEFNPKIIFTHSDFDVNMDHRIIFQACLQSTRPTNNKKIVGLISFEILSSTEWKYKKIFEPNLFIDISKEIKYKILALKKYRSEIRSFPHPRSIEGIKSLAKYRGMQSFNKFAEAFKIIRFLSK